MPPLVLIPRRFEDERGWFCETWNKERLARAGIEIAFCQDNHSLSGPVGTVRGLHFQSPPHAQTKLVRCLRGVIFDVIVDIRRTSPTFGQWAGAELSADNGRQLLVPKGYAHGFLTLEPNCEVAYKVDDFYAPDCDGGLAWNDPAIGIDWPFGADAGLPGPVLSAPILSAKDAALPPLSTLPVDFPYDGVPLQPLREIRI